MPQAVVGIIVANMAEGLIVTSILEAGVLGAIATTIGTGLTASLIGAAASMVVGSAMARRQEKKAAAAARASAIASLKDVQSTIRSSVAPQQTVYGRTLVGGVIASWFTTGDVGQYHHWAQVLAGHEIDGVDAYWLGDEQVSVDANGWVTTAKFCRSDGSPLVRIRLYKGDQTTLDADFLAASAGGLSSADCGRGKAWLYVRFEADYDVFGQTGVPTVRAVVRGKPLYDPRTSTTAFSDNAALAVRDYLTTNLGLRCTAAEVNDDDIIAAANVCDEDVALSSGSQKRYTVNGALGADGNLKANLETLVDAMAGMATWSQGQWRVRAGAYETPVATIAEGDIIEVQELVAYTPRRELFNTVSGSFIDPANLYAEKQYPIVTNATYVTQDSGQTIERTLNLPMCNDAVRAQRMAKIEIERARQAVTVSMMCKWTVYNLTPGDHVIVNIARYGWAGKVFFVAARTLSPDGIAYTLRETAAAVWAWNYGEATVVDPSPNTSLPNAYAVPPITGLAATSGTSALQVAGDGTVISRIRLSWDAVASIYVQAGGRVEVNYRPQGAADWMTARADGDETATFVGPVQDGIVYELRARAANSLGQRGAWSDITHTVVGKTEPPPDVESFAISGRVLTWPAITGVPDLAGYLLRFQYGQNTWWPSAAAMHDGVIVNSPYTLETLPPGPITLLLKAVDTSGNESANAVAITANLGDAIAENLLVDWPQAPAFTGGTVTAGVVESGMLQGASADAFYGAASGPFYGQDADGFYAAATWSGLGYEVGITPEASVGAATMRLSVTLAADSYTIDYQRDSQAAFYGLDGDAFYQEDGTAFFGTAPSWTAWPGAVHLSEAEQIRFRVTAQGGTSRPQLSVFTPFVDVPDITERINDVAISAAGTRLPITLSYRAIANVGLTVQADGNGGVGVRIKDKNASLGPLIEVVNGSGTAVAGLVDADIQGY